jgi:hypothetical protein
MAEASEFSIPTPKTPTKHKNLTRDDRLCIQTLFFHAGFTKDQIALQLPHVSIDQIKYAISHRLTPQKTRSGRCPLFSLAERKQLIDWVYVSKENRRVPWKYIPGIFGWDYRVYAIETAFKMEGFSCYSAVRKPKLTAE